jgi:protoporphyrinogen oxidase
MVGNFKIIIIGGGLAGNLLANGLILRDIDVVVYEKDERGSKREGYQIRIGAAALVGFRACLQSERMDLLKKFGRSGGMIASAPILYDTKFNCLLDLTKFPSYTKSAPINRVILRDFLAGEHHQI